MLILMLFASLWHCRHPMQTLSLTLQTSYADIVSDIADILCRHCLWHCRHPMQTLSLTLQTSLFFFQVAPYSGCVGSCRLPIRLQYPMSAYSGSMQASLLDCSSVFVRTKWVRAERRLSKANEHYAFVYRAISAFLSLRFIPTLRWLYPVF